MVHTDHISLTCPFVDGPSGCLRVLATVNTAAVSTQGACVFLNYGFLSGHAIKGKKTGHL